MLRRFPFRSLVLASSLALLIILAIVAPGASADGQEDQAPTIPDKGELKYPNLGSALNDLVVRVEDGEMSSAEAAGESAIHQEELVAVTIHLSDNVDDVVEFLEENGGDPRNVGEYYIEAYVTVTLLGALSEQPGVIRVREIVPPEPAQLSQRIVGNGPAVHGSQAWNDAGFSGQGIKVGVIDLGFRGISNLQGTELPSRIVARCYTDVGVFTSNLSDCEQVPEVSSRWWPQCVSVVRNRQLRSAEHGTWVAEAVLDMAPEVELYIAYPQSKGDLKAAADWMASQGVQVINHSVGWTYDGPGDGTSPFSFSPLNTVEEAVEDGVLWVNAAGNSAEETWLGSWSDPNSNDFLNFAGSDENNDWPLRACRSYRVQLRWDDDWDGASTDLDLYIIDKYTNQIVSSSRDVQSGQGGQVPYEWIAFINRIDRNDLAIVVTHEGGAAPDWVQVVAWSVDPLEHHSLSGSISNPAESDNSGLLAVGAAPWFSVQTIEPFSSQGPTPDGRPKPDIVGADCGATALLPLQFISSLGGNCGFPGTSQASPHVAGMAALVRQRFPDYTPAEVAGYLKNNAERRGTVPNNTWGYGFATLPSPDEPSPPVPALSNVFTRNPAADFDTLMAAGNQYPEGIWSDGTTMWVADYLDEKIYAYGMATRARVPGKDFDTLQAAGNTWPKGIWSDGTTMWVADYLDKKVYAYEMATKARVSGKEFDTLEAAGNQHPEGIWSDGTTMWVADSFDEKIYAYEMATRVRVPSKDFDTLKAAGNRYPRGIWSDGTIMWVANSLNDKVYAYDMTTKARVSGKEFNTLDAAANWTPRGIWSDGTTMWVADWDNEKIYAYRMRKAVVFGDPNWTSGLLQTEIARHMVEHGYGYATERVPGTFLPLFQGLRDGDIHLLMEVWLPNWSEPWGAALSAGDIVDLGTSLGNDWQSAFVIPSYLQDQYPGLDHVEDLKQRQYKSLFSTAETGEKARLVSCVVGWICEEVNRQQIEGYGLQDHVHIINPGTAAALNESLYAAYENGEPWLGYQWGTNDAALLLDLVRLEEPAYSDECWSTDQACAYEDATILIGAHSSLAELAPGVVDFLEQWEFSVDVHLRYATRWMDSHPEASIEEAALNWLANNVDTWNAWVTEDAAAGILATLPEVPVDLAALVALYNATGGPNWTNNTNWLTSAPMAQWHGVTVDANGRVASLSLSENGLTGKIPVELGNLTGLTVLNLNENQLGGEIPGELGSLTNLEILALAGNELTGTVPTWLGSLTKLEGLYLWDNELTGAIPSELASLSSLRILELGGNELTGTIPSELASLTNLETLALGGNELTGTIPSELANLSNLETLALGENELTGTVPAWLGSLSKLEGLYLWDNELSGEIPAELGSLTKLTELSLWGNGLTGEIPSELVSLTDLQRLFLSDNQLTGTIPAWLGSLTELTELSLWGNGLTGEIPSELVSLTELQRLFLSDNQLTGTIPAWLGSLTELTELSLRGNELTGEIPASLGLLANLTLLYLSGNQLTGCVPDSLQDVADNDFVQLGLNFCPPEDPLIARYDVNRNGIIDRSEVIKAINDYLSGEGDPITRADVIRLINLYLSGESVASAAAMR